MNRNPRQKMHNTHPSARPKDREEASDFQVASPEGAGKASAIC